MVGPPETELIAQAKQGDVNAFCLLISGHRRGMLALAVRFCGNHHDAEDLTQEVFLNAYRAIKQFRGEASFHSWLRRIMVNSFINHQRRRIRRPEAAADEGRLPSLGSERIAFNHVMVQQVLQRLEQLPPRQRLMFILKYQEGRTCEEIAGYFGTTVGTVKKTLFRTVDKLRREFHPAAKDIREGAHARLSEIP